MKKILLAAAAILLARGSARAATEEGPVVRIVLRAGSNAPRPAIVGQLTHILVAAMAGKIQASCEDGLWADARTHVARGVACKSSVGGGDFRTEYLKVAGSAFHLLAAGRYSKCEDPQGCRVEAALIYVRAVTPLSQNLLYPAMEEKEALLLIERFPDAFVTAEELKAAVAGANATFQLKASAETEGQKILRLPRGMDGSRFK